MGSVHTSKWKSVERWSPVLFLIGGGLMVGHATMLGVQAFSTLTTPPDVFGPLGHLVALLGLFGLYPVLIDGTKTVGRAAGTLAIVGVGSWTVLTVTRFLAVAGIVTSVGNVLPAAVFALAFASTIFTYGLFGVAALYVDSDSRLVGGLLLAPAVLLVVVLVTSAVTGVSAVVGVLIGGGLSLSMLALGQTLRTWNRLANPVVPTSDMSVR